MKNPTGPSVETLRRLISNVGHLGDATVVHIADMGYVPEAGMEKNVPSVLDLFDRDPKLGIAYGQGGGHAFIVIDILKRAANQYPNAGLEFSTLCQLAQDWGYHVEEICWLFYRYLPSHQGGVRDIHGAVLFDPIKGWRKEKKWWQFWK